jgi:transposase
MIARSAESTRAEQLASIVDHAPGPRLVVSIEGTRSYGLSLARAVSAAGLHVVECEQPNRKARRGKGKSDPIDAHLTVLTALRLDADRLPRPRADSDREALRTLLSARHELTTTSTAQVNRLRALLLGGGDTDRQLARSALTEAILTGLARHRGPATPAASTPCGRPRSDGSPWPCATPGARSWLIALSCRPSSMILLRV